MNLIACSSEAQLPPVILKLCAGGWSGFFPRVAGLGMTEVMNTCVCVCVYLWWCDGFSANKEIRSYGYVYALRFSRFRHENALRLLRCVCVSDLWGRGEYKFIKVGVCCLLLA